MAKQTAKKKTTSNKNKLSYAPIITGIVLLCVGVFIWNFGGEYNSCHSDAMCNVNVSIKSSLWAYPAIIYGLTLTIMWLVKYVRYKVEGKPAPDTILFASALLWAFVIVICSVILLLIAL